MTTTPENEPEALPVEGQHPDDDPSVTVDPADEELEEDHDTEPDLENGLHEELPEVDDSDDEPVLDEDPDVDAHDQGGED